MDEPILVDSKTAASSGAADDIGLAALAMETVEFELALQLQSLPGKAFEAVLADALENVGGALLFNMPVQPGVGSGHVAAVSLPSGEGRILALVIQSADGILRVEPAEQSANPVARIVPAYAGVMEHFAA
ncbi:MAG: hypothetical protein EPN45_14005 [Rhizobiaceae bacterium]|nr:MAG: hypothetical protein EPN45_14005 [Rhizobiaceae bacterium]